MLEYAVPKVNTAANDAITSSGVDSYYGSRPSTTSEVFEHLHATANPVPDCRRLLERADAPLLAAGTSSDHNTGDPVVDRASVVALRNHGFGNTWAPS